MVSRDQKLAEGLLESAGLYFPTEVRSQAFETLIDLASLAIEINNDVANKAYGDNPELTRTISRLGDVALDAAISLQRKIPPSTFNELDRNRRKLLNAARRESSRPQVSISSERKIDQPLQGVEGLGTEDLVTVAYGVNYGNPLSYIDLGHLIYPDDRSPNLYSRAFTAMRHHGDGAEHRLFAKGLILRKTKVKRTHHGKPRMVMAFVAEPVDKTIDLTELEAEQSWLKVAKAETTEGETADNQWSMTPVELTTFKLLIEGASRTDMAQKLGISTHGVSARMQRIYKKTGVHNRAEMAILAYEHYGEEVRPTVVPTMALLGRLTPTEQAIIATIRIGCTTDEQLAKELSKGKESIKVYMTNMASKLKIANRARLAVFARQVQDKKLLAQSGEVEEEWKKYNVERNKFLAAKRTQARAYYYWSDKKADKESLEVKEQAGEAIEQWQAEEEYMQQLESRIENLISIARRDTQRLEIRLRAGILLGHAGLSHTPAAHLILRALKNGITLEEVSEASKVPPEIIGQIINDGYTKIRTA